ncbi:hypothetical protein C8R46DRAFT_1094572 [Mycena filopes]|nr:hypothetical protein C8R46DRAFT_1094572 [Mycena filopes]
MTKIHPALRVEKTSNLPSSLRLIAAAAINGSLLDLLKLYAALEDGHLPVEQAMGALPVLYIYLDTSHIPDSDELEDLVSTSTQRPAIELSLKTLYALYLLAGRSQFPYAAAVDIWPRLWKWLDFLHTYWDHLPGFDRQDEPWVRMRHSTLIVKLSPGDAAQDIIVATPRTRWIIAGGWAYVLNHDFGRTRSATLADLVIHLFALAIDIKHRRNFDEILDALDRSCGALVTLLLKHISLAVAEAGSVIAADAIKAVVLFVQPILAVHTDFTSVLLSSYGFISALVSALAVERKGDPGPHRLVDVSFALLLEYMKIAPGYTGIVEALRAGLLSHVVRFLPDMVRPSYEGMYETLEFLLRQLLPSSLVCYSVLVLLRKSLAEIEAKPYPQKFSRSILFEAWNGLKVLVDRRVKVLDAWEASRRSTFLVCDNLKCGKIDDRHQFKHCSACQSTTYCSRECQRVDWRKHRSVCAYLRMGHTQFDELALTTRDKLFLRRLIDEDYKRLLRPKIARKIVTFLYQQPTAPYCVHFNYEKPGDVIIEVLAAADDLTDGLTNQGLAGTCERVGRARGRMELHVMRIGLGSWVQEFVFPLRTTGTRLHEGLRRIAGTLDALTEVQMEALIGVLVPTALKEGKFTH